MAKKTTAKMCLACDDEFTGCGRKLRDVVSYTTNVEHFRKIKNACSDCAILPEPVRFRVTSAGGHSAEVMARSAFLAIVDVKCMRKFYPTRAERLR